MYVHFYIKYLKNPLQFLSSNNPCCNKTFAICVQNFGISAVVSQLAKIPHVRSVEEKLIQSIRHSTREKKVNCLPTNKIYINKKYKIGFLSSSQN